jgi:hypothetical protein
MARWFKNLKRWQKGGLIGCAVGIFFACVLISFPQDIASLWYEIWEWLLSLHILLVAVIMSLQYFVPLQWVNCVFTVIIIVFYGGFGAVIGKTQQLGSLALRWLITGLLILFILFIYSVGFMFMKWFGSL